MQFADFIPIICAIISFLTSWLIAKHTTKKEIKKISLEHQNDIDLKALQAYSNLKNRVNAYVKTPILKFEREALSAVGEFIPFASATLLPICHSIENALNNSQHRAVADFLEHLDYEWLSEQEAKKN